MGNYFNENLLTFKDRPVVSTPKKRHPLLCRAGYRNTAPVPMEPVCTESERIFIKIKIKIIYLLNLLKLLLLISVPHFGAMPERSVEIFVLCFSETDVRSIITGTTRAK